MELTVKDEGDPTGARDLTELVRAALARGSSQAILHERLADALRSGILSARLQPGGTLPGERNLALSLAVSRVTVRRAIKTLVDERLLIQRAGARTSVAGRVQKPVSQLSSFSQDMQARGLRPGTIWLAREVGTALSQEALALQLSPGAQVCRLKRLRTADGVAMALEWSVIPASLLPDPKIVRDSLYAALAGRGVVPCRALQRMRAVVAGDEDARLLNVASGAPLLEMERRCFDEIGTAVETCRSLYRGDAYDFLVELARPST